MKKTRPSSHAAIAWATSTVVAVVVLAAPAHAKAAARAETIFSPNSSGELPQEAEGLPGFVQELPRHTADVEREGCLHPEGGRHRREYQPALPSVVMKPLWSPIVDVLRTKRWWILTMQLLVGAGMAGVALSLPAPDFFRLDARLFLDARLQLRPRTISPPMVFHARPARSRSGLVRGHPQYVLSNCVITGQGLLVMVAGALETCDGILPTLLWRFAQRIASRSSDLSTRAMVTTAQMGIRPASRLAGRPAPSRTQAPCAQLK